MPSGVEGKVVEALARFEEDMQLIEEVPAASTQAAATAVQGLRVAVYERFVESVRAAVGETAS